MKSEKITKPLVRFQVQVVSIITETLDVLADSPEQAREIGERRAGNKNLGVRRQRDWDGTTVTPSWALTVYKRIIDIPKDERTEQERDLLRHAARAIRDAQTWGAQEDSASRLRLALLKAIRDTQDGGTRQTLLDALATTD